MEAYLRGKAELGATQRRLSEAFEKEVLAPEYLRLYLDRRNRREENPETVVSVEGLDKVAEVITAGRPRAMPKRYRYHLRASATSWQIHEMEWECFLCDGTGVRDNAKCHMCAGNGWKAPLKGDE
jgi:hypothetical protein